MTSLSSVVVPQNALLIAENAFPTNCVVDRRGTDAEFSEERKVIEPG
jgi:hypothetical protein